MKLNAGDKSEVDALRTWVLGWIPMVPLAIINAITRETVYAPYVRELTAHQISSVTAVALFAAYTWLLHSKRPLRTEAQALKIGVIWVALTVAFEFTFGHYVMGNPWSRLLNDYNLLAGRIWSLVLASTVLLPYAVHKTQKPRK